MIIIFTLAGELRGASCHAKATGYKNAPRLIVSSLCSRAALLIVMAVLNHLSRSRRRGSTFRKFALQSSSRIGLLTVTKHDGYMIWHQQKKKKKIKNIDKRVEGSKTRQYICCCWRIMI
jgi:hypothetical protein